MGIELTLNPPLLPCIHACMTVCLPECCGIAAFDFGDENVRAWASATQPSDVVRAREQLTECIALIEREVGVTSMDLNHTTGPHGEYREMLLVPLRGLMTALARVGPTSA